MSKERGFQLVELVVVLALMSMAALIVVPPVLSMSARLRTQMAAHELMAALYETRALAQKQAAYVGIKFYPAAGRVAYACYRDGDGDGVRTADITSGVDPQVTPLRIMIHLGGRTGFGFPPGRPPRDPGDPTHRLDRLEDPIRFNDSDIASYGPLGTSTPGSLYVTDGRSELVVVRVLGMTGKVRVMRWVPQSDAWK